MGLWSNLGSRSRRSWNYLGIRVYRLDGRVLPLESCKRDFILAYDDPYRDWSAEESPKWLFGIRSPPKTIAAEPALNSNASRRVLHYFLLLSSTATTMSSPPPIDFPTSDDAEMEDGTAQNAQNSGTGPLFLPGTPSAAGTPARHRGSDAPGSDVFRGAVARRAVGMPATPRRGGDPLFLGELRAKCRHSSVPYLRC